MYSCVDYWENYKGVNLALFKFSGLFYIYPDIKLSGVLFLVTSKGEDSWWNIGCGGTSVCGCAITVRVQS